MNIDNI